MYYVIDKRNFFIMSDIGIMRDVVDMSDIKRLAEYRKPLLLWGFESVDKPSSVVYGHLSTPTVADRF